MRIKIYDLTWGGQEIDSETQMTLETDFIDLMKRTKEEMVSPGNMGLAFLINNLVVWPTRISLNGWHNSDGNICLRRRVFSYNGNLREARKREINEYEIPIIEAERISMQRYVQGESFETWLHNVKRGPIRIGTFS